MYNQFALPQTLSDLLSVHSGFQDLIAGGDVPEQVADWKKKELLVRTAILNHSIGADRGPKISLEVLSPLSLDTLELLDEKLEAEVRSLQLMVGQSSTKLIDMQTLHRRVKDRIGQKTGGLRLVA